jgi:hypothetical protein
MAAGTLAQEDRIEAIIHLSFARFDIRAFAMAVGLVVGGLVWLATVALLLKGAPPGTPVGPHLAQLWVFFPGYSVTWPGSLVGLVYGFVLGVGVGGSFAFSWNLSHYMILMRARGRYGHGGDL